MRLTSSASILPALALVLLPAALAAQTAPNAQRPPGCRGTNSQTSNIALPAGPNGSPIVIPSYSTVESVTPGSPAQAAGMRPGDIVITQNGRDLVGNPPTQPALAGDTVELMVRREGRNVTLRVVLGAWDPPQEQPGVERVCRPVASTGGD